jgi:transposase
VVTLEQWQRIRHLEALGWSRRRIARELGLNRRTIARALDAETPPRYQRSLADSPLQPWLATVAAGVRRGLRGSRVLRDLRQAGYTGSRSAFYERWAALIHERRAPEAACRFETEPGEQAQFDWAEYSLALGGIAQKVYVYSLLLGFSRRVHWFPSLAANQEAVFEALEAGLGHFGGVCRFLVIDNPKVFLLRHQGPEIRWNPNFQRFAGYYRFQPIACTPRHPQGKGKVENPFFHLEQLFLLGRTWRDWSHFQEELATFEAEWEQRIHGTTKVPPLTRFENERAALLPLPPQPFLGWHEAFRQVSKDCLISFAGVRYSVPWPYATQQVLVRQSQGREVAIFAPSGELLVRHPLQPSGAPPVILPAHYEGLRRRHQAAFAGLARAFREQYGEAGVAETFLQRLLAQHRHHPETPLRRSLDLLSAVPAGVAQAALADAVEFNLCTPRFLEERLRQRAKVGPALQANPTPTPAPLAQLSLPRLEVERPLLGYGRALTEPERNRPGKESGS